MQKTEAVLNVIRSVTILLNAKNLPTNVVSTVFKTKLRPRFIGPFTVVGQEGSFVYAQLTAQIAYTPVFYIGFLKPYRDLFQVDWEALAPRKLALPRLLHPNQEVKLGLHPGVTRLQRLNASLRRVERTLGLTQCLGDHSAREVPSHAPPLVHRPPQTLLDEKGNRQFHVEKETPETTSSPWPIPVSDKVARVP